MSQTPEAPALPLENALGDALVQSFVRLGEQTLVVKAQHYAAAMRTLRDHPDCRFEQLIDLCGMDYSGYGDGAWEGPRFAVVVHLMSL
ncbi:MAG: NADH-quinone oxidoreductase subunit C, partial [Gammaproteobacteria bacterium]